MKRTALVLITMLSLAGCNVTPASLGITGPAPLVPPTPPDDSTIDAPGLAAPGSGYGSSIGPAGTGRYFNYN
jgi:hypothetical protein